MEAILEATTRDTFGKNEARRTRRGGRVPAVLYGEGRTATPIAVEPKALLKILHSESGANTLIALKIRSRITSSTRISTRSGWTRCCGSRFR
jgi:large subunit ribosomal protein L25